MFSPLPEATALWLVVYLLMGSNVALLILLEMDRGFLRAALFRKRPRKRVDHPMRIDGARPVMRRLLGP